MKKLLFVFMALTGAMFGAPTTPIQNAVMTGTNTVPSGTLAPSGSGSITATLLQNVRTIGGSNFDGTANVTSFPSPGAIGGTTPSTGVFNAGLSATSVSASYAFRVKSTNGGDTLRIAPLTSGSGALIDVADSGETTTARPLQLGAANGTLILGGVPTVAGSFIRTPATITVTAGAGTIDVTKGYSQASVVATTTLTPSAAGTAGQFITLDITADSTQRVVTVDTLVDFAVTCPPLLTTTLLIRSTGSGWVLVGGSPNLVDATADTTPATTKIMGTADPTTGAMKKSTIAQIMAAANLQVGALANGMTATTQSAADNSTKIATTAYADAAGGSGLLASANTWTNTNAFQKPVTFGSTQTLAAWTTAGAAIKEPAASYTDSSSSGTVAIQAVNNINVPTLLASSSTTYTDSFTWTFTGPPVASTNVTQTRAHSLGVIDTTSAASAITGAFVVTTTPGTAATSVGIGAGNIYAGGTINATGNITGAANVEAGTGGAIKFNSRLYITAPADGVVEWQNNSLTTPTRFDFGGTTNSFPGLGFDAVNGFTLQSAAGTATWNDASTAGSGTVANRYLWGIAAPTLTATNSSVTDTVASTFFIGGKPTASTNTTIGTAYALLVNGNIISKHATDGLGYGTGAGGAVTQASSRTTGVTLNNVSGAITLVSAAGSTSWQTFTVTDSAVVATDTIIINQKSGTDLNEIHITAVGAGTFNVSFKTTGGTTTEQPVFNFAVIKAVAN